MERGTGSAENELFPVNVKPCLNQLKNIPLLTVLEKYNDWDRRLDILYRCARILSVEQRRYHYSSGAASSTYVVAYCQARAENLD
jgi:hypothetical protein